jgi:hypothetical protein
MLRNLLIALIMGIVLFLAQYFHYDRWIHPAIWYIYAFYTGLSFFTHRLMEFGHANDRKKFVKFYGYSIGARLILSIVFIGTLLYAGVSNINLFIINFFVLYLFYTSFEIYGLYCNLRRD